MEEERLHSSSAATQYTTTPFRGLMCNQVDSKHDKSKQEEDEVKEMLELLRKSRCKEEGKMDARAPLPSDAEKFLL